MDDVGCEATHGTYHKGPGAFGYGRGRRADLAWVIVWISVSIVCEVL
jgi:hypothetical protein